MVVNELSAANVARSVNYHCRNVFMSRDLMLAASDSSCVSTSVSVREEKGGDKVFSERI